MIIGNANIGTIEVLPELTKNGDLFMSFYSFELPFATLKQACFSARDAFRQKKPASKQ